MNDIKWIKNNKEIAKKTITLREEDSKVIDSIILLHKKLLTTTSSEEELLSKKNSLSKSLGRIKGEEKLKVINEVKTILKKLEEIKTKKHIIQERYQKKMLEVPNLTVSDLENKTLATKPKVIRKGQKGKKKELAHWDLFKKFNLARFDWSINTSGSRFVVYVGEGARLRRSIINYQSDFWSKKGYLETLPPVLVTKESMISSGQFPKFISDAFIIDDNDKVLTGTSEIAICNFFKGTILPSNNLPQRFTATTLNFRSEVGSAGKDVRGSIRMHQFTKTELFKFTNQEQYEKEYDEMINSTTELLESYELPFQSIQLPFFDLGFHSEKTIDFEVWVPSNNAFREVSSCSRVGTFQSRRASIRHRANIHESTELCYTMNGTGVAVDRILLAIVENNFDEKTNTIRIPKVLVKYFGKKEIILESKN